MYLNAPPDLRVTIEDLVAEDDKVGVRRSYEGTHQGELLGIPATGKQVRTGSIAIFRPAGGRSSRAGSSWTCSP
jgi:predicted ester cyclase